MALGHLGSPLLCGLIFLAASAAAGAALPQLPEPQTANGIEYVTGGFGADMSKAFKEAETSYPLALTFAATDEGGGARPYVAEVDVVIRDATGSVVMSVPSAGPYFFARLKPGRYTVEATYLDKAQTREVIVKEGATTRDVLTWPRP